MLCQVPVLTALLLEHSDSKTSEVSSLVIPQGCHKQQQIFKATFSDSRMKGKKKDFGLEKSTKSYQKFLQRLLLLKIPTPLTDI